jgi:hypothetical protein
MSGSSAALPVPLVCGLDFDWLAAERHARLESIHWGEVAREHGGAWHELAHWAANEFRAVVENCPPELAHEIDAARFARIAEGH